jgi:hypothetical protein
MHNDNDTLLSDRQAMARKRGGVSRRVRLVPLR